MLDALCCEWGPRIRSQLEQCPEQQVAQFHALAPAHTADREVAIFRRHSLAPDPSRANTRGLYLRTLQLPHSCDPNCFVLPSGPGRQLLEVRALRRIEAGARLSHNYLVTRGAGLGRYDNTRARGRGSSRNGGSAATAPAATRRRCRTRPCSSSTSSDRRSAVNTRGGHKAVVTLIGCR